MAASIYGSQNLSANQSLAAYLQALQTKTNNPTSLDSNAGSGNVASAGTVSGTTKSGTGNSKDPADQVTGQPLDTVTLSAEAQRLLANAQAPSAGPGSLATYLNTSNATDTTADPFGDIGAIAQFRQWLSQPLGQPIPYPGDQSAAADSKDGSTTGDQQTTTAPAATSSTST
jgi:hypothetical protein